MIISTSESEDMKKGIKDALLKEFDGQIRESLQEETRIINRAKLALKKLEKELSKPSQSRIYSSMHVFQ